MIFFDATVTPSGLVQTLRQHESEQLVSKAVNLFGRMLDGHGSEFEGFIPERRWKHLSIRWTSPSSSSAVATFDRTHPADPFVLVSGGDTEADAVVLDSLKAIVDQWGLRLWATSPGGLYRRYRIDR